MLIGGLSFAIISGQWKTKVVFDIGTVCGVIAISVIGTAVAFSLYLQGIQEIGPVKASMLASIEPVAATLFSFFWLKTPFTSIDILGFVFIMTTVFLLSKKPKIKK